MALPKRILLLGANGLLGQIFKSEFQRRSITADCLGRAECDVTDPDQLEATFQEYRPDVAINCTAYTKVDLAEQERDQAFAINATAVGNIARACLLHQARMIHFSTDFVFDGTSRIPYQPADQTNALSVYGQSKLRGEHLLQEINPPRWLIARTSWLFGITGPCFPKTILDRAMKGQPLKIVNDQIGSPTYAADLANAVIDLLGTPISGLHQITNSGSCSWFDFAKAIVAAFEIESVIEPVTTAQFLAMRPAQAVRPMYSVMEDREVQPSLGRPMRSWKDTLADYRKDWLATHPGGH